MARKPREPFGLRKKRTPGKGRLEELGEGVHKTGLWILGMLYVFILMALIITLLSVIGIVDPSERPAQQLRELELVPGEPDSCHPSYDKCLDPDAIDYDALLADPRMQERVDPSRPRGQLFPACDLEGTGFALPARRTVQTVAAFGEQGVVQSICDPTFGRALRGITSRLGELIRRRRCR